LRSNSVATSIGSGADPEMHASIELRSYRFASGELLMAT